MVNFRGDKAIFVSLRGLSMLLQINTQMARTCLIEYLEYVFLYTAKGI